MAQRFLRFLASHLFFFAVFAYLIVARISGDIDGYQFVMGLVAADIADSLGCLVRRK